MEIMLCYNTQQTQFNHPTKKLLKRKFQRDIYCTHTWVSGGALTCLEASRESKRGLTTSGRKSPYKTNKMRRCK